jgi:hypothetical protein
MYYIYHIPTFVWKDGSIGKIGCTTRPKQRVSQQGYSSYEILETHDCIDRASQRELELQKEYGYKVDKATYIRGKNLHTHRKSLDYLKEVGMNSYKNKTGFFSISEERMRKIRKKAGNTTGKKSFKEKLGLFSVSKEQKHEWCLLGAKAKSKPILQFDLDGNLLNEYASQKEAERKTGVRQSYISYNCVGKQKTAGGFIWKYKDY